MRSRYAAFVVGDTAYLAAHLAPAHPAGRPRRSPAGRHWQGLTVLATADGREDDSVGEVEFEAAHAGGVLHERSRFVRRAGRWVYVDGDVRLTTLERLTGARRARQTDSYAAWPGP